ncbi:XkdX family protein [Caproiciproducens sp.]|nr:XkdX family protein [Caproiciproducens sp.]
MTFWSIAYQRGWATKSQVGQAVTKGQITSDQYQQITGEVYSA